MIGLSKKLIYVSSLALLSLAGATKVYAADSDYSTLKPHSMLTTAYAAAWNDVNKASDAKGTGDGKSADGGGSSDSDKSGDDAKGDDKGKDKDKKGSDKKGSDKKGSDKKGSSKSSGGGKKNSEARKSQRKTSDELEKNAYKEINDWNKRVSSANGGGGDVAHGNGNPSSGGGGYSPYNH